MYIGAGRDVWSGIYNVNRNVNSNAKAISETLDY